MEDEKKVIDELCNSSLSGKDAINTDSDFIKSNFKLRSESYTNILSAYCNYLIENNNKKTKNKKIVFWVSLAMLLISFLVTFASPIYLYIVGFTNDSTAYIITILPILISFVTSFMIIPNIITNYLFNKEEEKYMTEIVTNTQKFDYDIYCKESNINADE